MTPETFTAVARYAMVPMILLDGEGYILATNGATCDELGMPVSSLMGKLLGEIVGASEADARKFIKGASRSRELYPSRFHLKGVPAGSNDYVFEGALLVPGSRPQERRLIVRFQQKQEVRRSFIALNQKIDELMAEVAHRKMLEEEKSRLLAAEQQARREVEKANRSKDEFLAAVSHELRTPMHVIKGWADLLSQQLLDELEYPQVFETISRNADIEVQLINDLLDVLGIVTGKLSLDIKPVQLSAVLEAAVETIKFSADAKQVKLSLAIDPSTGLVAGDADRLQQVIWNLLINAIKFSDRGGKILVSLSQKGSNAEISVEDKGIGIDPSFLPYVFERFRQEDGSHTRAHGGLGLGLTIVRHIVEQLGGTVGAASEGKGKGATFTFRLPLLSSTQAVSKDIAPVLAPSLPAIC